MFNLIKVLFILFIFTTASTFYSQQWVAKYNGNSNKEDVGFYSKSFAIATGNDGSSYVAGCSGSPGVSDMCIVKYDSNGDTLWTRFYNGGGPVEDNKAYAITIDKQWNIIVTGYSTSSLGGADITTIKYTPNGDCLWYTVYNDSLNGDDKAYAITIDAYNSVYITGYTTNPSLGTSYITIKYNSDGAQQWAAINNGGYADTATAITMVGDNYVAVTGRVLGSLVTIEYNAQTGNQAWISPIYGTGQGDNRGNAITSDNAGNVYVTGYVTNQSTGKDIVVVKINSSGNISWQRTYDNCGFDEIGNSIGLSANNVIVTGTTATGNAISSYNYVTVCYTVDGDLNWVSPYNGPGSSTDISYKLAVSSADNSVYVTGMSMDGMNDGSQDMFTMKYDIATGNILDSSRINTGPTNADVAYDVKIDAMQNVFITGCTTPIGCYTVSTGGQMLTAKYLKGKLSKNPISRTNIPKQFKLFQNYPNPFNPGTIIKFEIAKYLSVKLVVYDILGREIQTLVNNNLNAGSYAIPFNNAGIASGIYFYELTAGDFRDIKKMIILK